VKDLPVILYATISTWEIAERIRRRDLAFDAWAHVAKLIGHKNPSTLRKMCEPHGNHYGAKLGFREAVLIMNETKDYRLFHFMKEEMKKMAQHEGDQMDLFAHPIRSLNPMID
jgi:hypothetical protein